MKNYFYLLIIILLSSSCKEKAEITNELVGHWMNKGFYEEVISKKNIAEITSPKTEIIIKENDTNYTYIVVGKKVNKGPFIIYKKNHLVIKNYYALNRNAEIILNDNNLEIIDSFTGEKEIFVKIDPTLFNPTEILTFQTFSIPFVNKQYISGKYQLDTSMVIFKDHGQIIGLDNIMNYSFCYDESCRNDSNNSIFLANNRFEGNYYEYEMKQDSLIIYDIDLNRISRGYKSGRMGVKFAMKKIN